VLLPLAISLGKIAHLGKSLPQHRGEGERIMQLSLPTGLLAKALKNLATCYVYMWIRTSLAATGRLPALTLNWSYPEMAAHSKRRVYIACEPDSKAGFRLNPASGAAWWELGGTDRHGKSGRIWVDCHS